MFAPLKRTVGSSHVLLGSVKAEGRYRYLDRDIVYNLGQPMRRHLHRVSTKELFTIKTDLIASLHIATMLDIGDP